LLVLMNADTDRAVAYSGPRRVRATARTPRRRSRATTGSSGCRWRAHRHSSTNASSRPSFGHKNATAGPARHNILIHFRGTDKQRRELLTWLDGWSLALDETNHARTGYRTKGILDVHLVTDTDIAKKTSYAVKIGAVTDPARPLALKKDVPEDSRPNPS
jgi:hypothetical protein